MCKPEVCGQGDSAPRGIWCRLEGCVVVITWAPKGLLASSGQGPGVQPTIL